MLICCSRNFLLLLLLLSTLKTVVLFQPLKKHCFVCNMHEMVGEWTVRGPYVCCLRLQEPETDVGHDHLYDSVALGEGGKCKKIWCT